MKKSIIVEKVKNFMEANRLQSEAYILAEKALGVWSVNFNLNDGTITAIIEEKYKKGFRTRKCILKLEEIQ